MTTLTTGPRGKAAGRSRTGRGGFTLLELVLVMVIMCTVLAMAAPSLRGFFASRQTADAAAQIVALTQLARSLAVTDGCTHRLNFDAQGGTYWLTAQREGAFVNLSHEFGRVFVLPEGTTAQFVEPDSSATLDYVQFYPDGSKDAAVIRLADRRGNEIDVACPSPAEPFVVVTQQNEVQQ